MLDEIRIGTEGFEFGFHSQFGGRSIVRGSGWKIQSSESDSPESNDACFAYLEQCQIGESVSLTTPDGYTIIRDRRVVSVIQETHGASSKSSLHIATFPEQIIKIGQTPDQQDNRTNQNIGDSGEMIRTRCWKLTDYADYADYADYQKRESTSDSRPAQRVRTIPYLYMGDMPNNVIVEVGILVEYCNLFTLSWSEGEEEHLPQLKRWMISTYGDDIKRHKFFAIANI